MFRRGLFLSKWQLGAALIGLLTLVFVLSGPVAEGGLVAPDKDSPAGTNPQEDEVARSLEFTLLAERALQRNDYPLALKFALEATAMDDPPALAQEMLSIVAYGPGMRYQLETGFEEAKPVSVSPDGEWLLASGCVERVQLEMNTRCARTDLRVWALATGQQSESVSLDFTIEQMAFAGDNRLVTVNGDRTLSLWDFANGQLARRQTLEGHADAISTFDISEDGQRIASGSCANSTYEGGDVVFPCSEGGEYIIWDAFTGELITYLKEPIDNADDAGVTDAIPTDVVLNQNGTRLLTTSYNRRLILWELGEGGATSRVVAEEFEASPLAFLGDDDEAMLAEYWDGLLVVDLATGEEVGVQPLDPNRGRSLSSFRYFSEARQAVSYQSATVQIFETRRGRLLWQLQTPGAIIEATAYSPEQGLLVTGHREGQVQVWDVAGHGAILNRAAVDIPDTFYDFGTLSPDGQVAIGGTRDDRFVMVDAATGAVLGELEMPFNLFEDLFEPKIVFSPDGSLVAGVGCSSVDLTTVRKCVQGGVVIWDVATREVLATLQDHPAELWNGAFSQDNAFFLSAGCTTTDDRQLACLSGGVILWELSEAAEGGLQGEVLQRFEGHTSNAFSVTFDPAGPYIYSAGCAQGRLGANCEPGQVIKYDIETGEPVWSVEAHGQRPELLRTHPEWDFVLSGLNITSHEFIQWKGLTGERGQFVPDMALLAVSADGRLALSEQCDDMVPGATDCEGRVDVVLWELATGEVLRRYAVPEDEDLESVAFGPDEQTAVALTWRENLYTFRLDSLAEMRAWAFENRHVREWTCEERAVYGLTPLCE